MDEPAGQNALRSDIQALRALAVIGVVACHMNPAWLPGGFLGVDVFFVVSGFVITRWLLHKQQGINLLNFWLQRVLRIVPAYVVMLTVVATGTAVIFLPENFGQFAKSWLHSLIFVSNRYFANYGDYFSPALHEQPLLHTWSLAIEMQFYLVYPPLFLVLRRTGQFWILPALFVIGLVGAQWAWSSSPTPSALYYALLVRAPEFLLGCSLAVFQLDSVPQRPRWIGSLSTAVGLALILVSFGLASERWFNPLIALVACSGAGLVIWGRSGEDGLGRLLASRWILLLGALSYSIYLWHWPVLALVRYAYGTLHWDPQFVAAYVAVVLGLSWVSWNVIENRFRARDARSPSMLLRKFGAVGLVALSPLAYASQLNARVPELPVELTRYAADDTICHGKILPSCVRGVGLAQWLMIGDSHAAQLNVAADAAGRGLGMGLEVVTASSCVPLDGFLIDKLPEWARAACLAQIQAVSEKLPFTHRVILAGMWSYQFRDKSFPAVLEHFFASASERHQQVLVLAQIPKFTKNPRRLARLQYWKIRVPPEQDPEAQWANARLRLLLAKYPEVVYFDPGTSDLFSTAPFHHGTLMYQDEHHLNEVGSREYGSLLVSAIQSVTGR